MTTAVPDPTLFVTLATAVAMAMAGAACGRLYFALLWRSVGLIVAGGDTRRALVLTLGRVLGVAALLAVAVQFGAVALLAALAGLLVARALAIRNVGEAA